MIRIFGGWGGIGRDKMGGGENLPRVLAESKSCKAFVDGR